jgi:hypothetical protein
MKILQRDFGNHQIIIASINEYNLLDVKKIELNGELLGF